MTVSPHHHGPNAARYHFADFTTANYRRLVRLARARYPVRTFAEIDHAEPFVVWRHDVDFSPQAARRLARVEADEDVRATYFVLLHSQFYNLLEPAVAACVREILTLGHSLGLHFDAAYYNCMTEAHVEEQLQFERELLERVFGTQVSAFSFHITTPLTLSWQNEHYAGMINAFSRRFQTEVGYCSDSNGHWRHRRLEDVLSQGRDRQLQILTHPEMWQDELMSPRQRIERCIQGRADATRRWYESVLRAHGRENIDW